MLPGAAGIKVFMGASTGDLLVSEDDVLAEVLASGRRRVAIHAEDEARMQARMGERVEGDPSSHPVWRDDESAILATRRILKLARAARRRIHVDRKRTRLLPSLMRNSYAVFSLKQNKIHDRYKH